MKEKEEDDDLIIEKKSRTFDLDNYHEEESSLFSDPNFDKSKYKDERGEALFSSFDKSEDSSSSSATDSHFNFKYYLEFFLSIFFYINSFISFSFMNIFHISYSFYLLSTFFSTYYTCRIRIKKYIASFIIISNSIYLIVKVLVHIYLSTVKLNKIIFQMKLFIINDNWSMIYDYVITCFIILILIIYLLTHNFTQEYFSDNEVAKNIRFLDKRIKQNSTILNLAIFLICLGCTIFPTFANLCFLLSGLLYFYSKLIHRGCRKFMKKKLKYVLYFFIILYTLYVYLCNSADIFILLQEYSIEKKLPSYFLSIIRIFEFDASGDLLEYQKNFFGICNLIFFYIALFTINFHLKILDYIKNTQEGKISQKNRVNNDYSNINNSVIETLVKNNNSVFIVSKEKTKLQTLFDADIDCGLIAFLNISKNYDILHKCKILLKRFCYTPSFCLHACRLGFIFWINFYTIFHESYFIIIWIILSVHYSTNRYFVIFTKIFIYPLFCTIFVFSYFSTFIETINIYYLKDNKLKAIHFSTKLVILTLMHLFIQLSDKYYKNLKDKEIKDEINNQKKSLESKIDQDFKGKYVLKPLEIFFKLYFLLIDVFVIIFFYLAISQSINLFNEIILFGLFSLFAIRKKVIANLYLCLCVISVSFLLKYSLYLFKIPDDYYKTKLILSLLFNDDLHNIFYYWIAFYFLFLQYSGQTSKLFKLCKSKHFSMYELIEYNFSQYIYIKFILNTLFNFIFGIYIWLLIPCFILCLLLHDNNCFALFQLLIVFVIYYKYIKVVGNRFKKMSNIYTYTKLLIITTVLYFSIIYIIQLINKQPLSLWFNLSTSNYKKLMELIGLFLFTENYQSHFFSFFIMLILSIALHSEIDRQEKLQAKDSSLKHELEIYSYDNAIKKFNDLKNDNNEDNNSTYSEKRDEKERIEKIEKKLKENEKTKNIVKKIFTILYYILHYYWIIIFIFIAALSIHWMLSISMIIQLSIFSFYMAKSFNGYYKCLKYPNYSILFKNKKFYNNNNINLTLNQKMKLYRKETHVHFKITSATQKNYFNLIWIFTISFIIISYLCSIVLKYLDYLGNKENLAKYISALMYFFGTFSESQTVLSSDSSNDVILGNYNFWSFSWGYFIIIGLFSIRAYFLSKFAEMKLMYNFSEGKDQNNSYQRKKTVARASEYLELAELEKISKTAMQRTLSYDIGAYDDIYLDSSDDENNERETLNYLCYDCDSNQKNGNDKKYNFQYILNLKKNKEILTEEIFEKSFFKRFMEKYFKKEFEEYLEVKNFEYYNKDDIKIYYKKNVADKNLENTISFKMGIKKFLELTVIILLFINALYKCNILSFLFLIIILITYRQKSVSIHLMFRISFLILMILILQYIVFVSNLSYITNPFVKQEIIINIKKLFNIPWYKNYRWSTFYSLGTNRYQIITIWIDVIIILILYFYLEYFSFTIYKEHDKTNQMKDISEKYNKKFSELKAMSNEENKSFIKAMKTSYNIELRPSNRNTKNNYADNRYNKTLLKLSYIFTKDKRYSYIIKKSYTQNINKVRNFLFLSFQYLLLILTLLISCFIQGLNGLGYICFSVLYIYKTQNFLKGRTWTLLFGIHYFMKPYLFHDLLIQFILQIPLDKFTKNSSIIFYFFRYFGYVKIADYSSNSQFLNQSSSFIVLLKIICYFLLLIQENLYSSYEFKKFILKYHYKYLQKAFIKGKLHAFMFNNYRLKLMEKRAKERTRVKENLSNLEHTINNWNINLTSYNIEEKNMNNNNLIKTENLRKSISNNKKFKGITISDILRKHWLMSIILRIIKATRSVDDIHYNISGEILKILQGNIILYSYLDRLIDEFEDKNYEIYGDLKKFKKLKELQNKKNKKDSIDEIINKRKQSVLLTSSIKRLNKFNFGDIDEIKEDVVNENLMVEEYKNKFNDIDSSEIFENRLSLKDKYIQEEIANKSKNEVKKVEFIDILKPRKKEIVNKEKVSHKREKRYIKLDQTYDDMFFEHADYQDLKKEIRNDFFNNYCSRKKLFVLLIKAIFNYFFEKFDYIVYFIMIINHLINGTITSLPYVLSVFLFGLIQYPRPARVFWKILMIYTTLLIFFKFLIQLNVWEMWSFFQDKIFIYLDEESSSFKYFIGLKKIKSYTFFVFIKYVNLDFIVLISLISNQFILIRKGLWYMTETDYESIQESNERIIKYNSQKVCNELGFSYNDSKILTTNEIVYYVGKIKEEKYYGFFKRIQKFNQNNFTQIRNEKPGKDFYTYYTITQIFILIYIIFFYTKMEKDTMVYNVDVFQLKRFSGNMVIFAFIHVFLLVFDRYIYLKSARKLRKILFKVYDKNSGSDVTAKYKMLKYEEVLNKIEEDKRNNKNKNYQVVTLQIEACQLGLILKYLTQIIMVIFIHLFINFYLPFITQINQNNEQQSNQMISNPFILIFYLLYIFYFVFSGFQIKYGLIDMKKVSSLMRGSNLFYNVMYKCYKEIPFLFELKNFIDWTFTGTALDLWKWLKLEEIISLLYINKCYSKGQMDRRVGTIISNWIKFLMGSTSFFTIILLIFAPLVLFSSLNPVNMFNSVIGVELKIILSIPNTDDQRFNLTLFETTNSIISGFNNEEEYANYLTELNNNELSDYNKSFTYNQVQKVKIIGFSEFNWVISNNFTKYIKKLNRYDNYDLILKYSFKTQYDDAGTVNYEYETIKSLDESIIKTFAEIIFNKSNITKNILINEFYSPYQRVQRNTKPMPLISDCKQNATLIFKKIKINNKNIYKYNWYLKKENNGTLKIDDGIEFLTFSDLYSKITFGYDVLTFYVSFIYLAGQLIRSVFLGAAERIIYTDMVNTNKLFSVCQGIKISRFRKDYVQEEKLYYLLIDLMRSPEMIKNMTQSSLIFIQNNNIVQEKVKIAEFEVPSNAMIKRSRIRKNKY